MLLLVRSKIVQCVLQNMPDRKSYGDTGASAADAEGKEMKRRLSCEGVLKDKLVLESFTFTLNNHAERIHRGVCR